MNMLGTALLAAILSISIQQESYAQSFGFVTSNDRSLYDAQTRALRQKARTQLDKDTEKLKELSIANDDLKAKTARIEECAGLDKVYNGDPTNSNDPNVYCQDIVGAIPSELNFKGLAAWYDISTEDGYTLKEGYTDKIAELLDKSGNLNHLYHNATPPTLRTTNDYQDAAASNIKVIAFDAINNRMTSKSEKMATATSIKGDSAISLFVVAAPKADDIQAHGIFSIGNTSGQEIALFINQKYGMAHVGYGPDSAGGSSIPTTKNRLQLIDFHRDSGENFDFYLNGKPYPFSANTRSVNVQDGFLSVGAVYSSGSSYAFEGDFAELILYNRELTSLERSAVQSYLINKYSLQPFNSCTNKSVNTGQCTISTGTADHGTTANLSCSGTYGSCTSQQYCNNGTWEEKTNSCPPPANCTSSATRTINHAYGNCSASTGTGNHGVTANLSCAGNYGTCTAKSDCYNGAWGAAYNANCQTPANCSTANISINHTYGTCTASASATTHGESRSVNCVGTYGTCTANTLCNNGTWSSATSVTCPAPVGCSAYSAGSFYTDTGNDDNYELLQSLAASNHGVSLTKSTETDGRIKSSTFTCNNGTWEINGNYVSWFTPTSCHAIESNRTYSFLTDPLLNAYETHTAIPVTAIGGAPVIVMREDDGATCCNDKVTCNLRCTATGWEKVSCAPASCSNATYTGVDSDIIALYGSLGNRSGDDCSLSAIQSGQTRTGSCARYGSCKYSCSYGNWTRIVNSCNDN